MLAAGRRDVTGGERGKFYPFQTVYQPCVPCNRAVSLHSLVTTPPFLPLYLQLYQSTSNASRCIRQTSNNFLLSIIGRRISNVSVGLVHVAPRPPLVLALPCQEPTAPAKGAEDRSKPTHETAHKTRKTVYTRQILG